MLVDNGRRDEALEYSLRYENEGQELRNELRSSTLALRFAKQICDQVQTQKSCNQLVQLTKYMNNPDHRIAYLKIAKKYRETFNILCTERKYDDACRLCMAQGWFDEGLKLAEGKKNQRWTLQFVFLKAISGISRDGKIGDEISMRLQSLTKGNAATSHVKAKVYLLLGRSSREFFFCRQALKYYTEVYNLPGCVESFSLMVQYRKGDVKNDIKQILDICSKASFITEVIKKILNHQLLSEAEHRILTQIEEFYGLQKSASDQNSYCLLSREKIWVQFYGENSKVDTDLDGMIQIDSTKVLKAVLKHIQKYLKQWKENDELQVCQQFRSELKSFRFHTQIQDGGYVLESYKMKYSRSSIYDYLKLCCLGLEISAFSSGAIDAEYILHLLSNILTPAAMLYLDVTKRQMQWIATCAASSLLEQYATTKLQNFDMNNWLEAWRILSIIGNKSLVKFWSQLKQYEEHINSLSEHKIPKTYVLDISGKYVHVFSMWIRSCELIQKEQRVVASSKVILHYVLKPFIHHRDIRRTLSITNLVNILIIHSTALLSVTALCNHLLGKPSHVLIPESYLSILNVFDNIGRLANKECIGVFKASMNDDRVMKAYYRQHAVLNLQREITPLLWEILNSLLGISKRFQYFRPLEHSMQSEMCIKRGEARHCLVLVLILFGNLTEIDQQCTPDKLLSYHTCINSALQVLNNCNHREYQTLQKAYTILSSSANATGFFSAIGHIINVADPQEKLVRISVKTRPEWRFDFNQAHTREYPARSLLSTKTIPLQTQVMTEAKQSTHASPDHPANTESTATQNLPQRGNVHVSSQSQFPMKISDAVLTPEPNEQPLEIVPDASDRINFEDDEDLKHVAQTDHSVFERQSSENIASTESIQSEKTEDVSMISKEYCMLCETSLRPDDTEASTTEKNDERQMADSKDTLLQVHEEESSLETYTAHLDSEKHAANVKDHECMIVIKRDHYEPLKEQLYGVLKELKRFVDENSDSNLHMTIQEIEKEITSNDESIDRFVAYAQWKDCVLRMQHDMLGKMKSLIHNVPSLLAKEQERIVLREQYERTAYTQESFGATAADEPSDEDIGGQSDEEINEKLNRSKAKEKERQGRRSRKEREKAAKCQKRARKNQ